MTSDYRRRAAELGWVKIKDVPEEWKDGRPLMVVAGGLFYSGKWQLYYDKWPHQEGGPTFRGGWSVETWDQHMPMNHKVTHARLPLDPNHPDPAAALISDLIAEVERLREVLQPFAERHAADEAELRQDAIAMLANQGESR